MKEAMCTLLGISGASYYRWKKERKIFPLVEKYFTPEEIEEFLDTGRIARLDGVSVSKYEEIEERVRELEKVVYGE